MKKRSTIALAALAAALGSVGAMASESGYKHPVAVIPYAVTKPVIDGKVDDVEWQGAFSQRALRTLGGQISARQARVWMMWDEENIYLAMRDPLRPGERPIQQHRGRERGQDLPDVIHDDSYEIWVSVGATDTPTGQPDGTTQFLANFAGARYDVIWQPAIENVRARSYDTNWEPKSRLTDKNEWEMELVIPRASLGTTKAPFHDGLRFRMLFARNYKRPWEQNSFEGTTLFQVIDTHSEFVMSKTAPALHLLGVGDAAAGKLGLRLAARGQTDAKIAWRYASDTVTKDGAAEVRKGKLAEVVNLPALDTPGDQKAPGTVRITVTDAGGATLLDWQSQRSFGPVPKEEIKDRGDLLNLGLTFYPVHDNVRVVGDFINYDNRDRIHDIAIVVRDAAGKEIKRAKTTLDADAYAREVLHLEGLALGAYTVRLECLDKKGKLLAATDDSTFVKEDLADKYACLPFKRYGDKTPPHIDFGWWNTPRGGIKKVLSPWTPVTLEGNTLGVWGREMEIGAAGIPARVTTQGKEILAAPGRLVATLADGKQLTAEDVKAKRRFDTTGFNQDHCKIVEVESRLGDIAVTSEVRAEFDGMYKVTLTLTPRRPVAVKDLKMVLPYAEAMGEYVHAVTADSRSGYYCGVTPRGPSTPSASSGQAGSGQAGSGQAGRVWDCRMLGDKTMKVGSFIPYIWLGSTKGGLCWFADSDEGWIPNDEVPAIEIQRNRQGQVDLVFNLISAEATLDAPRTITFALQASPVKAMPPRWRDNNWSCDDTIGRNYHATIGGEIKLKNYGLGGDHTVVASPIPYLAVQNQKMWARSIRKTLENVTEQQKTGRLAVPFSSFTTILERYSQNWAEGKDLAEEWQTTSIIQGERALAYGGTLNDYLIRNWSTYIERCRVDGCYIDNVVPIPDDTIGAGRGYRLPDGRIQPAFQMFGTREYFLRLRAAFLEQRPKSMVVLHVSNSMILPWIGAADLAFDGEHQVIYPEMKKDFMDFWSLERMRGAFPGQWGVPVDFMHAYRGQWAAADLHRVKRAYFAAVLLHDALPYGNDDSGHTANLEKLRRDFGVGEDDVRFLPYWDETGLSATGEDIKLAGWQRPNKLLLLVANFGEAQTAQVALDLEKLGWKGATLAVSDPERGQTYPFSVHGPTRSLKGVPITMKGQQFKQVTRPDHGYDIDRWTHVKDNHGWVLEVDEDQDKAIEEKLARSGGGLDTATIAHDAPAPKLDGTKLTVPVERHNYRLLVVERK